LQPSSRSCGAAADGDTVRARQRLV